MEKNKIKFAEDVLTAGIYTSEEKDEDLLVPTSVVEDVAEANTTDEIIKDETIKDEIIKDETIKDETVEDGDKLTESEVAGMFEENIIVTGGNEVIGGEAEYAINDLIINYNIIDQEFLSRKSELSNLDNYDEIRKKYLDKLMTLFTLNAKTIKEFDQELQEMFIMDDISLFYILFKRFRIKELSINKIVNELNEKLNKKYFSNKIKLDKEYPLQQFSRLFKNIPKDSFVLPKFNKYEKIDLDVSYSDKKLDSSCKTCIYNRIYFLVDYLNKKIISLKDKFIQKENEVLSIVKYLNDLDL